ncbi:hypothetical protein FN846DRAFT_144534 [Sphaerosporella brunnea]|uniref:Inner centromere protein ARK-binding domain-containing protein n=1 Tax=Sphaerosporella brunnea TaxID=1250544 RepID=A0A5J5ER21_9PEZI|nr:hypothetical protein FN846DRAFT_144534 [Sphaerosporella brunnea]
MAELMKTPGRLRGRTPGKTPRTVRRPIARPDEPSNDIFTAAAKTPAPTRSPKVIAQASAAKQSTPPPPSQPHFLPFNSPQLQTPAQPPPSRSPVKTSPRKQPSQPKIDTSFSPIKELAVLSPPPAERIAQPNFADSGFFTSSNANSQVDAFPGESLGLRGSIGPRTPLSARRQSRREGQSSDGNSRNPFSSAKEETSFQPSSPIEAVALLGDDDAEPEKQEHQEPEGPHVEEQEQAQVQVPKEQHEPPHESSIKSPIKSPLKNVQDAVPEPRRSGRLAAIAVEQSPGVSPVGEFIVPASPLKVMTEALMVTEDEPVPEAPADYPALPEAEPEPEEALAPEDSTAVGDTSLATTGIDTLFTTARPKSPELPPSPEVPMLRKNSMNFASLPAREPLTNKKKSSGAKVFRESQLDQLKQGDSQRPSWMKKSNGKSLGGSSRPISEPAEEEEKVVGENGNGEEPERPRTGDKRKSEGTSSRWQKLSRSEDMVGTEVIETVKVPTKGGDDGDSDAELRLHNKTSTQRLHDKIQQLGKLNARTVRSFPAPAQQSNIGYPDLSLQEQEDSSAVAPKTPARPQEQSAAMDIDEDSPIIEGTIRVMPQLTRSKTEGTLGNIPVEETEKRDSPYRPTPIKNRPVRAGSVRSIDTSIFEKSVATFQSPRNVASPPSPLKTVKYASINDIPQFAANKSLSPKKTPSADTALSAVKAHTSTMIQKAKEMWMKSSATSESARIEGMTSPPPLRKWQGAESLQDVFKKDELVRVPEPPKPREDLYPDLGSVLSSGGKGKEKEMLVAPLSPAMQTLKEGRVTRSSRSRVEEPAEATPTPFAPLVIPPMTPKAVETEIRAKPASFGRQTRSSKPQEDQQKAFEPQPAPPPAPKAKKSFPDAEAELKALKERERRLQEILEQEKKDRMRLEQQRYEDLKLKEPAPIEPTSREPAPEDDDEEMEDEEPPRLERPRSRFDSAEPGARPKSRLEHQRGMRFQQNVEPKRLGRTAKDQPAVKPAPVAMKISTASQREMNDQQRMKNTINVSGPSSTALVSALKNSFEPVQPSASTLAPSHSSQSLKTSSSNGSLKSTASGGVSVTSTKQLRSLQSAASQRRKEQEEKEKKAAQKKEIDRRRLENQKRLEEEQKRMQAQRLKATTPGSSGKPLSRSNPQLRSTSQEPDVNRAKPYGSLKGAPYASIKRALPNDREEEQQQNRMLPPRPGTAAASYHDGQKKRRTNDYEEQQRDRYEMPPPIRASMVKKVARTRAPSSGPHLVHRALPAALTLDKDTGSKNLTQGYGQGSSASSTASSVKSSSSRVPQVESVKFSKDKIRFGGETPAQASSSAAAAFKTPGNTKTAKPKTPAGFKESPLYPNGDQIELPDIPTDSEDDDDYGQKEFTVPQWAESPELRALLRQQQTVDPTQIFGPMAKLDMDAIFKGDGKPVGRFRARTSSANWGGADKLTQAEIIADQEARRKMTEMGRWAPSAL